MTPIIDQLIRRYALTLVLALLLFLSPAAAQEMASSGDGVGAARAIEPSPQDDYEEFNVAVEAFKSLAIELGRLYKEEQFALIAETIELEAQFSVIKRARRSGFWIARPNDTNTITLHIRIRYNPIIGKMAVEDLLNRMNGAGSIQ